MILKKKTPFKISMASTQEFQVKPDYYFSKKECVDSMKEKPNTNPRYKNFTQTHFTAGDEEQFQAFRDPSNGQVFIPNIMLDENRFCEQDFHEVINWEKYHEINAIAVTNTFYYMFEKFKKGIFIKIKNNELAVFLPFSKKNFINEWAQYIRINPKYGDMIGFMRYIYGMEGRKFLPKTVNKFTDSWYSNNSLVRFEFPISEGDTNHPNISDMFKTLCQERDVPDIEVFINRRDFPMIKKDGTESYDNIFGSNKPLISHNYDKYAPILSMVTREGYADIPIPTGEDWSRVSNGDGKFFPKTCRDYLEDAKQVPWNDKISTAIFRGSSTGSGVTVDTNSRLKLAYLSKITPPDEDGIPLLNAGITSWNLRPRKLKDEPYLTTIDINKLPFGLVDSLTPQEQSEYKYIINVDGHVSAFRLSLEMGMGSCILLADSVYKLWFRDMLQPYVHYVPVKNDLSDLIIQIKWCKNNDKECRKIAKNAKKFHDMYLTKDGVLDYLQKLFYDLKTYNGVYFYNEISPFDLQVKDEEKQLDNYFPDIDKPLTSLNAIPSQLRSYGMLQGIHWVLNRVNNEGKFFKLAEKYCNVFHSRSTVNDEYSIAGVSLIAKTALKTDKERESIHEAFVTTKCVNELCKYIPNFAYNFGLCRNDNGQCVVLTEYIDGQTLSAYIQSSEFNMHDYFLILLQLSLTLHMAQQHCALVHNDLTPWNVIIQKFPSPVEYDYIIDYQTVYRVKTNIVPVIIDFGKSHVIYEDIHYGDINMYNVSTIQDVLTILATTIYEITERTLPRQTVDSIVILANFLSGTRYRKKEFFPSGKGGVGELRYFFHNAKKYTHLVSDPKYELENKTPMDLFDYIMKNCGTFPIQKISNINPSLDKGNALQVFRYAFSSTLEEKIASFTSVFSRVKKYKLPETDNILFAHYIFQSIKTNMESVYKNFELFLETSDIPVNKYAKKFRKTIKYLTSIYDNILQGEAKDVLYEVEEFNTLENASYNINTFLDPKTILRLLEEGKETTDLSAYKNIIEITLLQFDLPDNIKQYYIHNCEKLLQTNGLYMKNNTANLCTLRKIATQIYTNDREALLKKLGDREDGNNYAVAEEILNIYDKILSR